MWAIRMDDRSKLERYLLIFIYFRSVGGVGIQPQNFHIDQAPAWKIRSHSEQLLEVCFPHLVVLFSVQDRIPSLWEGRAWRRRVGEAAQHVINIPTEDLKKTKQTKTHTTYLACTITHPCWRSISKVFYGWTHLVNSWKERKATIAPMRWQGGVKDVSSRTSLTLATCTIP